jgi:dienelactone hydrolase
VTANLTLPVSKSVAVVLGLVALAGVAAGCGGSSAQAPPAAKAPFDYDATKPLGFVDRGRVNHGYPIAVDDVSYNAGRDRIAAYLVHPLRTHGRLPAVVYMHGAGGDRTELVVPSAWLAARGAIALVITAPSTAAPEQSGLKGVPFLRWQAQIEARDVVAVRRGIDLLSARKDVDPARIGFVGWSSGAHTGGILAGVEPRLRAIVLMSGGVAPVSAYTALARPSQRAAIRHYLGSIDPLRYLRHARRGTLFLQDGRKDSIVPRKALLTFSHAAPSGTRLRWYDAGHALNDRANRDQLDWLAARLHVVGPPVPGAATGP